MAWPVSGRLAFKVALVRAVAKEDLARDCPARPDTPAVHASGEEQVAQKPAVGTCRA